jgi:hypothetical protein
VKPRFEPVTARRIPVLLLVVGLFLPFGEPQASSATYNAPVTCTRQFHVRLDPPLTFAERDHTFHEKGVFASCSDGLDGTLEFSGGSFRGSCTGGHASDDGGTTAAGKIIEGRFSGRSITSHGDLLPTDPQNCSTSGVTDADLYGDWTFQ